MRIHGENCLRREFANGLTHGCGLLVAIIGAALLINSAANVPEFAAKFSCWIYAGTMVTMYAVSTLSHLVVDPARKDRLRSLDQGFIFLFISATVTPFAVTCLSGERRWILLAVMWITAIIGFCSKAIWKHRVDSVSVSHYLILGWLPLTTVEPIFASLATSGVALVIAGGLCYTVGTVFLVYDARVRYFHALWHLFVVTGSLCHFLVIRDHVMTLQN